MISYKHRSVFIHVPRTGGRGMESFLRKHHFKGCGLSPQAGDYPTALRVRSRFPIWRSWENYFKFAFVRNPWDRAVSAYFYVLKTAKEGFKQSSGMDTPIDMTFEEFLMKYNDLNPEIRWHYGYSQVDILTDRKGKILVNFVGRFERLQHDFEIICDRLRISKVSLPVVNKTSHKPYWEYYTGKTKEIVAEKHAKDIEYFGFEF